MILLWRLFWQNGNLNICHSLITYSWIFVVASPLSVNGLISLPSSVSGISSSTGGDFESGGTVPSPSVPMPGNTAPADRVSMSASVDIAALMCCFLVSYEISPFILKFVKPLYNCILSHVGTQYDKLVENIN